jgi:hypothetical protein
MGQHGRHCVVAFIVLLVTLIYGVQADGCSAKACPAPQLKCDATGPRAGCGMNSERSRSQFNTIIPNRITLLFDILKGSGQD